MRASVAAAIYNNNTDIPPHRLAAHRDTTVRFSDQQEFRRRHANLTISPQFAPTHS
jgi:hypothetical protein